MLSFNIALWLSSQLQKSLWAKEMVRDNTFTGDSVGVVMDTAKGELSFALNGVNLGLAFEGQGKGKLEKPSWKRDQP